MSEIINCQTLLQLFNLSLSDINLISTMGERKSAEAVYNKLNGLFKVFEDHIIFTPFSSEAKKPPALKINLIDIKQQLVNASTSAKALMILVTNNDTRHRFQFTAKSQVLERQIRDEIKDQIATLINAVRISSSSSTPSSSTSHLPTSSSAQPRIDIEELRARQQILSSDPSLRKLHRELVLAGHLTDDPAASIRQVIDIFYNSLVCSQICFKVIIQAHPNSKNSRIIGSNYNWYAHFNKRPNGMTA